MGHAGRDHSPRAREPRKISSAAMGAAGIRCVETPADLGSRVRCRHDVVNAGYIGHASARNYLANIFWRNGLAIEKVLQSITRTRLARTARRNTFAQSKGGLSMSAIRSCVSTKDEAGGFLPGRSVHFLGAERLSLSSGKIIALVWRRRGAIEQSGAMLWAATDPRKRRWHHSARLGTESENNSPMFDAPDTRRVEISYFSRLRN